VDHDSAAALSGRRGAYDVAVVEADGRTRLRIAQQVSGSVSATQHETLDELGSVLDPERPAVVVFGPSLGNEFGFEQVERLTRSRPDVGVVVVTRELSTELLQHALRAGARDVVTLEGLDSVTQAVDRVGSVVAGLTSRLGSTSTAERGRLVVSFSTKGGVGKSVVATNIAVGLAQRSERPVAVIDADLQFGDVAVMLGLPPEHTVIDAAAAVGHGDAELIRSLTTEHASGLLVLPAPIEPSSADQVRPEQMFGIVRSLQEFCSFVIVDMPPHFDDLVLALIEGADEVLVIASMDIPSIKNLKVGMQTLDLLAVAGEKLHLVLNRANSKVLLEIGEIEQTLGLRAQFQIPSDISVPQAVNRGTPVLIDNPKSPAGKGLDTIVTWLLGDEGDGGEADGSSSEGESPTKKPRWWRRGP